MTHLLNRFHGTITVKPWPSGPMPRLGSPGSMRSWPSWRRKDGSTIWPDTPPRASWHVATSGSLGKTGWGSLMNFCWMLIGPSMLALGCGCPVLHSSSSSSTAIARLNLEEKRMLTGISSDDIFRCWRTFPPDTSMNHGQLQMLFRDQPSAS